MRDGRSSCRRSGALVCERNGGDVGLATTGITMDLPRPEETTQAVTAGVTRGVEEKGWVALLAAARAELETGVEGRDPP